MSRRLEQPPLVAPSLVVAAFVIGWSYRLSAHLRHGTASMTSTSSPVPRSSTRCRERRFLTREEPAEKVGSHGGHIGRPERDEVESPRMATIRKLAQALEVDPAELVD